MNTSDLEEVLESAREFERHISDGNLNASHSYLETALAATQRLLADDSRTTDGLCAVGRALQRLGNVQLDLGAFDRANRCYGLALDAGVDAFTAAQTGETIRVCAEAICALYRFDSHLGDVEKRARRRANLLKLISYMVHGDDPSGKLWAMRVCLELFADEALERGDLETARQNYEMYCATARGMLKVEESPQMREQLAQTLNLLADLELDMGDTDAASRHFAEELQIWESLLDAEGTSYLRNMSWCLLRVGDIEMAQDSLMSAGGRYEKALDCSRRSLGVRQSIGGVYNYCACLQRLGRLRARRRENDAALAYFLEALEALQTMLKSLETPALLHGVIASLEGLAHVELARDELDAAHSYARRSLDLSQRILALGDTPLARRLVFVASVLCQSTESRLGRRKSAAGGMVEVLGCLEHIGTQFATWPSDAAALSAVIVSHARDGTVELAKALDMRARIWNGLLEHLDLADLQVLRHGQDDVALFHGHWLNLVLELAPERIPEVLAAMQGRKIAALVLDKLDGREPAGVDAELHERFRRLRTELRRMALDLRLIGSGSTFPREASGDRSLAGLGIDPKLWHERVEKYKVIRAEYQTCLRDLARHPGFEMLRPPQLNATDLRSTLPDGQVLLVLVQPPIGGELQPTPHALVLHRDKHDLVRLPGLTDCVNAVKQVSNGTARHGADREAIAASAPEATNALPAIRDALWTPLLPFLRNVQALHVVTHGDLHVLPLDPEGMHDIDVRQYPGLVFYWLQHQRNLPGSNASSLAVQVYSPGQGETSPPIPFVYAEAQVVSGLWQPVYAPLPVNRECDVRVMHLAGHGEAGEGQDAKLLVGPKQALGMHELLRSQLRPEVVYISACLLGRTIEDSDGDPLGFVSTFMILGARGVVAPLIPVNDMYAPILAALFHWELRRHYEQGNMLDAAIALKVAKRRLDRGEWPGDIVNSVRQAYIRPFGEMVAAVIAVQEASSQPLRSLQADLLQSLRSWLPMCKLVQLAELCGRIVEVFLSDGPAAAAQDGGTRLADLLIKHRFTLSHHRDVRNLMMYMQAYGPTAEQHLRVPGCLDSGPDPGQPFGVAS